MKFNSEEAGFDALWQRTAEYYAREDAAQLEHTQSVIDFTARIAFRENLPPRQVFLLKTAALLHDIGCPAARAKHGKSLPPYQEAEGEAIVRQWLPEYPGLFTPEETDWIARVVGKHHHFKECGELHAEPLFEADLITNLLEGYYHRNEARHYLETLVRTPAGAALFRGLFPAELPTN